MTRVPHSPPRFSQPVTRGSVLALLLLGVVPQAVPQLTGQFSVGLDGKYVMRRWNAAQALVVNTGQAFSGELRVSVRESGCGGEERYPASVYSVPIECGQGTTRVDLGLLLPWTPSSATFQLIRDGAAILEEKVDVDQALYGGLKLIVTTRGDALALVRDFCSEAIILAPESAPTEAWAYDAADVIVLDECRLTELAQNARSCIREWTATGGSLVLTAPFLAANADSPELRGFTRVEVTGDAGGHPLDEVTSLFCPKGVAGPRPGRVLRVQASRPDVIATVGGDPLVFQHALGAGNVMGVTVDPQRLPFGTWHDQFTFTRHFWAKLLEDSRYPPFYRSDVPWSAVPDECRAQNTGWLIANVLVLFVAVVGPLNWAVLSHKKRKEWVVFTVPGTAFVFLLILAVVGLVIHARQPQQVFQSINLCTPGCDGVGAVRIHGVLAPGTGDYDLTFGRRDAVIGEFRQDAEAFAGGVASGTWFTLGEAAALPRVSTYRWAMRLFFDTGLSPDGSVDGQVWLGEDGLSGYVENHLPVALENCYLIHKWNHTAVGDIPRGERRELSLELGPPKLSDYKLSRLSAQTDLSSWLGPELWAGDVAGRGWELACVAAPGVGYRLSGPMLLGWGESLTDAPTSSSREYRVEENHLFVVRLPIVARGPELTVPVGGAICADYAIASRWLLTYPLQREAYRASEDPTGQLELQLPLGEPTARHRELKVCGRLNPAQEDSSEQAQQLQMYDWQKREWVVISDAVDETFSYTVQEPERFILMPAGLVRVAVHAPGDEYGYYSRLIWVDLEYQGEAVGR